LRMSSQKMEWPKRFIHKRHHSKAIRRSRCPVAFREIISQLLLPHDCDTGVTMPWREVLNRSESDCVTIRPELDVL
jgi:hypothetical protein